MNPNQLQALANQAQQHFQENRLNDARNCYLKISKYAKNNPGIWMALGAIEGKIGNFKDACNYFQKVVKLSPEQAEGYLNLAKSQSAMGVFQLAEENYKKALSIQPGLIEALINLANIQGHQKNHTGAIESYQRVLTQNPNIAAAHYGIAVCQQALKEYSSAEQSCYAALQLQAVYPEVYNSLGITFQQQGRLNEAITCYEKAIGQNDNYYIAYYNLGTVMHELGRYAEAKSAYQHALQINPQYIEAYIALGLSVGLAGTVKQSINCFEKALEIDPDNVEALINLAQARGRQGQFDQALELYKRSEVLAPGQIEAITGQVHALERKGMFDEAAALLKPLLDKEVLDPNVAIAFATLARRTGRQDEARAMLENIFQPKLAGIPVRQQSIMHFSLGEIYHDQKHYDLAFEQFQQANKLLLYRFSIDEHKKHIDQIIQYGNREVLDALPIAENDTSRPIFILGMPRSGTSLIEQIIASHPEVYGGGELSFIDECSSSLLARPFPSAIGELTQEDVDSLSKCYLSKLDEINSEAKYVTDKMPHNFMYLALIELILPQAKIIHCKRNPMDTCLSIYTQRFSANHPYSADLKYLGQYYLEYERLMQHWCDSLKIPVFEIQYEELIDDQENMTRRLIEFCGLDWDETCMSFHKSGREVATPSYDQVRQPLYKGAVERWRHYEDYLKPLRDVLKM